MNQEERQNEVLCAELEYRQQSVNLNPQILQKAFEENFNKPNIWQKLHLFVQKFLQWKIGLSFATSVLKRLWFY